MNSNTCVKIFWMLFKITAKCGFAKYSVLWGSFVDETEASAAKHDFWNLFSLSVWLKLAVRQNNSIQNHIRRELICERPTNNSSSFWKSIKSSVSIPGPTAGNLTIGDAEGSYHKYSCEIVLNSACSVGGPRRMTYPSPIPLYYAIEILCPPGKSITLAIVPREH